MRFCDKLLEGLGFCRGAEARLYTFLTETQCPEVHYYATTTISTNTESSIITAKPTAAFTQLSHTEYKSKARGFCSKLEVISFPTRSCNLSFLTILQGTSHLLLEKP